MQLSRGLHRERHQSNLGLTTWVVRQPQFSFNSFLTGSNNTASSGIEGKKDLSNDYPSFSQCFKRTCLLFERVIISTQCWSTDRSTWKYSPNPSKSKVYFRYSRKTKRTSLHMSVLILELLKTSNDSFYPSGGGLAS